MALTDAPGKAPFAEGKIVDTVEGYMEGEVIVDGALAKAGIDVDEAILTKAKDDLIERGKR